jgi:hypothetical protein
MLTHALDNCSCYLLQNKEQNLLKKVKKISYKHFEYIPNIS